MILSLGGENNKMAILWARRKLGNGTGIGDRGQQTFRTEITVKSNNPLEKRNAVLGCGLIPVYGAPHPENPLAVCTRVTADQNKQNPYLWDIVAEWQVNPGSKRNPSDEQKQPDQRRPKWSCRFVPIPMARFVDLGGALMCSSAGQPFDPVPDIPIIADEVTVTRYEPECNRGTQRAYMNKANSRTWFGADPGHGTHGGHLRPGRVSPRGVLVSHNL